MCGSRILPLLVAAILPFGRDALADDADSSPPLTYELRINGESFLIRADEHKRLESRQSPGTHYDVALRIALSQPVELNSIRFEYPWPAKVDDDHGRPQRTVRIRHELGYTLLVTDLGGPLTPGTEDDAVKTVSDSVASGLRQSGVEQMEIGQEHSHQFPSAAGRGVVIHYRSGDYDQTCMIYLLTGKQFAATCTLQYFDRDADNVLPSIRKIIESIRPLH